MKHRIAEWCRRLALWLDPPVPVETPTPLVRLLVVPIDALYQRAKILVATANDVFPETHDEAKRRMVYAGLLKDMAKGVIPKGSKRSVSQAIEAAVDAS